MRAFKIVDSDGYTHRVTKAKPTEAELAKFAEPDRELGTVFGPFTIESIKAKWATTHTGRRYLKVIDEADPLGAATDTIIGSPYFDVIHTQQGRRKNELIN